MEIQKQFQSLPEKVMNDIEYWLTLLLESSTKYG
ncbi:hypothetical protein E2C01_013408 [Portunus trituberculatus]|uniref:Uncharacterized protein n=1 Tax=Portunus trituberculatus TaxID=210409 RepID=A0A5B7DG49_PORTR|nr:hypothetical protein [Portunus trituberculatus]